MAGKLEAMLEDADDGLSASTIAERGNARAGQVRALLRELESSGQVRRTGAGRGVRWRLVTDEERIAQRTAELERLAATRS
ncbi:MAG: FaeA/PapI family transcriptional regulator [Solirubrobacteraceae bacterium]